jgi:hypothetical protein
MQAKKLGLPVNLSARLQVNQWRVLADLGRTRGAKSWACPSAARAVTAGDPWFGNRVDSSAVVTGLEMNFPEGVMNHAHLHELQ